MALPAAASQASAVIAAITLKVLKFIGFSFLR